MERGMQLSECKKAQSVVKPRLFALSPGYNADNEGMNEQQEHSAHMPPFHIRSIVNVCKVHVCMCMSLSCWWWWCCVHMDTFVL